MTRTISPTDLRDNLDAMLADARAGDAIIVDGDGAPDVVVISARTYAELQHLRELRELRRADAVEQLEAMRQRQAERNSDLSDEEIEEIAISVGREIRAALNGQRREAMTDTRSS